MNNLKKSLGPIFIALCLSLLMIPSCENDLNLEEETLIQKTTLTEAETNISSKPEKTCKNKTTSKICACGKTPDEAKLQLAAKARLDCVGQCVGQNCKNDKNCNLKKVKQKTIATIKEKEDIENPDGPMLWEACASFKCECICKSCPGKKQVAKDENATAPDAAAAFAMATQKAKAWCADFGCPSFDATCNNAKKCKSTGSGIVKKISEEQIPGPVPNTFVWKVTVLLTECSCKCAK